MTTDDRIGLMTTLAAIMGVYALALLASWLDGWFKGPWSTP